MNDCRSRATPSHSSASAARFASLPTATTPAGRPRRASISAPIAICVQPRFGARSSVRSPTSTRPGTATPTPATRSSSVWARANASRASAARSSSTASGGSSPSMRVRRVSKRTAPVRSSRPATRPSTAISRPERDRGAGDDDRRRRPADRRRAAVVGALADEAELVELGHDARDGALVEPGFGRDARTGDRPGGGDVPEHDAEVRAAQDGRIDARVHNALQAAPSRWSMASWSSSSLATRRAASASGSNSSASSRSAASGEYRPTVS